MKQDRQTNQKNSFSSAAVRLLIPLSFAFFLWFSMSLSDKDAIFAFLILCFVIIAYCCIVLDRESEFQRRRRRLSNWRREQRMKNDAANLRAQMQKPDFETRLKAFAKGDPASQDVRPESKMEFWERGEDDYAPTPSRPIELLRYLLQRISKLVGQSRS